jgi:Mannosyl-glycoprotein endo-beta-N-acetylglucosaminidase
MASGNYAKRITPQEPETTTIIPPRATRQLPAISGEEGQEARTTGHLQVPVPMQVPERMKAPMRKTAGLVVDQFKEPQFATHRTWLQPWLICMFVVIVSALVLLSAGMYQRVSQLVLLPPNGGQVYPIQVGGTYSNVSTWENSKGPLPTTKPITHGGPYSVMGKPTITAAFINEVLAAYHSPAAGTGQALYDLGVKYGIDPAFALAFFMHESTFGKYGMATITLSLGNMRCIPNYPCINNYAGFSSWQQGYEEWYKLIRNLYVAVWGKTTVAQIIPTYAPASDNNNEAAYIASVEHSIDTWHAGQIMVS